MISARSRYEDQHPGDYWRWKFLTFKEALNPHRNQGVQHILAFGDAPHDRTAMQSAIAEVGPELIPKVFECQTEPDIKALIVQLQMIYADILVLVQNQDAIDLYLPPILQEELQK